MILKKQGKRAFKLPILLLLILSCNTDKSEQMESLSLKLFSLRSDALKANSILSQSNEGYYGTLLWNDSDTIVFNFGYDIDNLSEKDPAVIYYPYNADEIRKNIDTALFDPEKIIYSNKPNFDIDEFRKQNVFFQTIDGYKAKITIPRDIKKGGLAGMYIDSLKRDGGGRLKFNIYANNLDSIQCTKFTEAIKHIKFSLRNDR